MSYPLPPRYPTPAFRPTPFRPGGPGGLDPLGLHIRDTADPHKVRDRLVDIGLLRKNKDGSYSPYLPMKADLVDGKVPASQLPESSNPVCEVTYSQLVALRTNNQLVPGQQYRITDYVAAVANDSNARSAGHPFDLMVVADSESKLNEKARAIRHTGDTYFPASVKFEAWQVWYCFDNDTSRFEWADTVNGKGVIYRLIDEWRNDCPYDFKGIQFRAYGDNDDVWRYTFDVGDAIGGTDYSLDGGVVTGNFVYGNIIRPLFEADVGQRLNIIVFKGVNCYSNTFGDGCYSNTFGDGCSSNTFGEYCSSNIFGEYCSSNTFGNSCSSNTFGDGCGHNTFGDGCYANSFEDGCSYNTFGNSCYSNSFRSYCESNTFGNSCGYNVFGDYCYSNIFGNSCSSNTFGDDSSDPAAYYQHITFEPGVKTVNLVCTDSSASSLMFQNVTVAKGVADTTISDPNIEQTYKTTYEAAGSQTITVGGNQ